MNDIHNPKVSVVMPVFNGGELLRSAIDSVLSQTMDDWELVVVNDGSTDHTAEILEHYSDQRIHVFHQANAGEAAARNAALQHTVGEYIAFLDADDLYYPNALQDLSEYLDQHSEFACIYSNGDVIDENGENIARLNDYRPGIGTGRILDWLINTSLITCPSCTMTRRSTIETHRIRFDEHLIIGPDWDFWIQLGPYASFGYLDELTVQYRFHSGNITRSTNLVRRNQDLVYIKKKVLNSEWFGGLSEAAKRAFFFDLLTGFQSGAPLSQRATLDHPAFQGLSERSRSFILREVCVDALLKSRNAEADFARDCIREALAVYPADLKNRLIYWAILVGKPFALISVSIWRQSSQWFKPLKKNSRKTSSPPDLLRPA